MYGFQNPYLPGNNQFMPQLYQQPQPQQQQTQVVRVKGRPGADAFAMGPNGSALLLDESGTMVWLCVTDGAGYKTISPYDITPHQDAPAPDYNSLENRIARLEALMNDPANSQAAKQSPNPEPVRYQANDANAPQRGQSPNHAPNNGSK